MRLLIDSLIAVMLVGILAGLLLHHRGRQQAAARMGLASEALAQVHEQVVYHAALSGDVGDRLDGPAFPARIDRAWFPGGVPVSPFAGAGHPWIDVAPQGDGSLDPPDPVLDRPNQAGLWYNPANGAVRVRVPRQITERDTLELYNRVNATALGALVHDDDPARRPVFPQPVSPPKVTEQTPRQTPASPPPPTARPTMLDRASG